MLPAVDSSIIDCRDVAEIDASQMCCRVDQRMLATVTMTSLPTCPPMVLEWAEATTLAKCAMSQPCTVVCCTVQC